MYFSLICCTISGHCEFDVALVFDSSLEVAANWNDVIVFAQNLARTINSQATIATFSRMTMHVYGASSTRIFGISQGFNWTQISDILMNLRINNPSSGSSGLYQALLDTRIQLRRSTQGRFNNIGKIQQAVIIFKHGRAGSDHLELSRELLRWFMDFAVQVVAIGRNQLGRFNGTTF